MHAQLHISIKIIVLSIKLRGCIETWLSRPLLWAAPLGVYTRAHVRKGPFRSDTKYYMYLDFHTLCMLKHRLRQLFLEAFFVWKTNISALFGICFFLWHSRISAYI